MKLDETTDANKGVNSLHLGSDPVDARMWINPEIRIQVLDHFWLRQPKFRNQMHLALAEVCAHRVFCSYY